MIGLTYGENIPLPSELLQDIFEYLCRSDVITTSSVCRRFRVISQRLLWRRFWLHRTGSEQKPRKLWEAISILATNAYCSPNLERLTIGPCDWQWTTDMLDAVVKACAGASRLKELRLIDKPGYDSESGGEFSGLLRRLARDCGRLKLERFLFATRNDPLLVYPGAPIHSFLHQQPTITHVQGLALGCDTLPATFLPNL